MTLLQDIDGAVSENLDTYRVSVIEMDLPHVPTVKGVYRVAGPHRHHLTDDQKCDLKSKVRERRGSANAAYGKNTVAEVAYNTMTSEIEVYNAK
jgi:hypothetical protein